MYDAYEERECRVLKSFSMLLKKFDWAFKVDRGYLVPLGGFLSDS